MKVLMVCLGNICRSPLAEGILQDKIDKRGLSAEVDSAGTAAYHLGEPPDRRSRAIAMKNGINIAHQSARQFEIADFERFDKIFAMDRNNYADIISMARDQNDAEKVEMIMNLVKPGENMDVPDPYYDGNLGFEKVYQMLDEGCEIIANMIGDNDSVE